MDKDKLRHILQWVIHNGILANDKSEREKVIETATIFIQVLEEENQQGGKNEGKN